MRFSVSLSRDDVEGERAGCLALVRVHRADAMMNVAADLEGCRPPFTLHVRAAGSHLKSGVVAPDVAAESLSTLVPPVQQPPKRPRRRTERRKTDLSLLTALGEDWSDLR